VTLLVKLNLQKTGRFEVREENRALHAIRTAKEFKPELILLDVIMPGMDGGDVLAELKKDANLRLVPVLFLTATVLKEDVDAQGGKIGGYVYIPKPFRIETLVTQIDKALLPAGAPAPPSVAAPRR
jgi:two-component system, OmpR family, response regulator